MECTESLTEFESGIVPVEGAIRAHNSSPATGCTNYIPRVAMCSIVSGSNLIPHWITTVSIIQLLIVHGLPDGRARDGHRRYFPP